MLEKQAQLNASTSLISNRSKKSKSSKGSKKPKKINVNIEANIQSSSVGTAKDLVSSPDNANGRVKYGID